jgi:hypothetical protein
MLTLYCGGDSHDCSGLSRRGFLRAGALSLGGLSLPWLLRARAAAGSPTLVRDKAIVLVFLSGGASQIETFNPNMDAPEPYRSVTGEVKTTIPGITFGGTFPQLAKLANQMTVVRSFRHPVGDHVQAINHVLTGGTDPTGKGQTGFSMGSLYARLRGPNHPLTGMPTYALLLSGHQDPQYSKEGPRVEFASRPGPLGPTCAPFTPNGGGTALDNMTLRIPAERLTERRELLRQLDELRHTLDAGGAEQPESDAFERQAVDLLLGGSARAFDLSQEDLKLVDRYDTSMFRVGHKVFEPSILGKQMLLARRLIEAGAGFVTVNSPGWDMHADVNNPGILKGMEMLGRPLDKALSAFLEDVRQRGLGEKVLVIVTGDFGRTPKINNRGGRDHWANLSTLAFLGGGLKMGQVIGKSDRNNSVPATDPISTPDLMATVMHYLFDVGQLRAQPNVREFARLAEAGKPIEELF